jgi:hypothetical protein
MGPWILTANEVADASRFLVAKISIHRVFAIDH